MFEKKELTKEEIEKLNNYKCPNCNSQIYDLSCDGGGTENYGCTKCGNRFYYGLGWGSSGVDESIIWKSATTTINNSKKYGLKDVKKFLNNNSEIRKHLEDYFSEDECLWRLKDGEEESFEDFEDIVHCENEDLDVSAVEELWTNIVDYYCIEVEIE